MNRTKVRRHPLDPLSAAEIEQGTDILREVKSLGDDHRFPVVALHEPDKSIVNRHDAGESVEWQRTVFVSCFDLKSKTLYEALVSLDDRQLIHWQERPEVQPAVFREEADAVAAALAADSRWVAALRLRRIDDPDEVAIETGPAGRFGAPWEDRRRVTRSIAFLKHPGESNYWAHPIHGLLAVVDTSTLEVLEVIDEGAVPIPEADGRYQDLRARDDVHPLEIIQPEGPSFELNGNELRWQKWSLRLSLHPVEGLLLHQVRYEDDGQLRQVLYRGSLSEMVVPYGDPCVTQAWRHSFDVGEAGVGKKANSLRLGCDCLGEIRYLDAVVADEFGKPRTIENAICVHEEDFGVAWKHTDPFSGVSTVRRMRRLVVSCFATFGNYDYGFYWYFYQDGSIELEAKLTGIVYTGAVADGDTPRYGELVAPGLYAPYHQHIFCFRLDFDLDGERNCVDEVEVVAEPTGPANAHGNAYRTQTTRFGRESETGRLIDPQRARYWKVSNPDVPNAVGKPVAYKLVPGYTTPMLNDPSTAISDWARFATKNLWVTAYDPGEVLASGRYPAWGDRGLGHWIEADRPIDGTDIVVWYSFAATHVPRPEDWPVMPVERAGFSLKPAGFFDRNPALDLPEDVGGGHPVHSTDGCQCHHGHSGS